MEGGEEDPYGSLVNFCRPTSSQELKLESCPFARESEVFPDAVDSLGSPFSPGTTQSSPPGIVMVSLPDSEDEEWLTDENPPLENEDFQTPPEDQLLSQSSSQEEPRRNSNPMSTEDAKGEADRATAEDESRDDEPGVENLGFLKLGEMTRDEIGASRGDLLERNDGFLVGLKEFGVSEGGCEGPALKKIRVAEEIGDSTVHAQVEVAIINEKVDNGDDEVVELDIDTSDDEMEHDENLILNAWHSVEESDDNSVDEVSSNNGEEGIQNDHEMQAENATDDGGSRSDDNNPVEEEEGIHLDIDGKSVSRNGDLDVEELEEEEGIHLDNGDKSVSRNGDLDVEELEEDEGVHLDNGDKSVSRDGDSDMEELEEEVRNNRGQLRECRKEGLNSMNREDIEAFNYNGNGSSDNGNQRWKEVVRRRRELPRSMRENHNERGGRRDVDSLDLKNLSPKELLDALAFFLKVEHDSEVDFLETAKRRGMTFPQPRWI
ncbi:OLC1v1031618C1 [Oldenlandia corymbosa var. corymbosa]|uniref:OLC1v1031618C1 n=1 Tax=Oldenlandia corymbosa var. corymbosa TaxID=529605 RepID=A0AAV1CIT1_OLDCO|nr:OLC1v1031618C1 [Oldenlandia corymbosa var. corymbosa]